MEENSQFQSDEETVPVMVVIGVVVTAVAVIVVGGVAAIIWIKVRKMRRKLRLASMGNDGQ